MRIHYDVMKAVRRVLHVMGMAGPRRLDEGVPRQSGQLDIFRYTPRIPC